MIRQSMAPGALRQSHIPGQPPNAAALAKLAEKKKEFEAVVALERASGRFLKRIDDLGDDFGVMADAGIVCGQVLEQWPQMFRILGLFPVASREKSAELDQQSNDAPAGERLVRVPIEELQPAE